LPPNDFGGDAAAMRPPQRLVDGELVLRPFVLDDLADITAAISASLDHLRPWMAWAHDEPMSDHARRTWLKRARSRWEVGDDFPYGIFVDSDVAGGCGLHRRSGPGSVDIGYWVHVDHIGKGIATRAARLLTSAAFDHLDVDHVDITHARDNARSRRVPEKLGYEYLGEEPDGASCDVRWRMTRGRWSG
jgi:ribosomal-protein-serine acetyltransferase